MKIENSLYFFLVIINLCFYSCKKQHLSSTTITGVDFTKGKWLLNQLDCPGNTENKAANFFENLNDRYFYRENVGLLIPYQIL
jgi:hypothetical protein